MASPVWCCSQCGAIYRKDFPRCPADGAEVVESPVDPLLGRTIDHYAIDALIGEGGMGRVYSAHHTKLANKRYAVKVLLGDLAATASARKRFVKEARSASNVESPYIVGVSDQGTAPGGLPYIVMEYVDGQTLTALIGDTPMHGTRVVELAHKICEGLATAHASGLVHRDLKPDNILVTQGPQGERPRIVDFGLAVTSDPGEARLTTTGTVVGTPAYASPEQLSGLALDHRCDLYALGMCMFEMLTGGRLPFEGSPIECATAKAHGEAKRIAEVVPGLEVLPELDALVASLVRRNPAERPADAATVLAALAAIARTRADLRPRRRWIVPAVLAASAVAGTMVWLAHGTTNDAVSPPSIAVPRGVDAGVAAIAEPAAPIAAVTSPTRVAPSRPAPRRPANTKTKRASVPIEEAAPVAASVVPPPVPRPTTPPVMKATIAAVDVAGSLSSSEVRRAVTRLVPALDRCAPNEAQRVSVRFQITEHRRAESVRTSGGATATNGCISRAFGALRTESLPDLGDVTVTAQIQYTPVP